MTNNYFAVCHRNQRKPEHFFFDDTSPTSVGLACQKVLAELERLGPDARVLVWEPFPGDVPFKIHAVGLARDAA